MKNKSTGIIIAAAILIFGGFFTWAIIHKQSETVDTSKYDTNAVIPASEENGNIAEHVEGNPDAEILFVEYSDYQCSGCASVVSSIKQLLEKYGDKIGVIHRTYVLSYHSNGVAAASAVEAAGLQGYWKKYGDYLFEKQADWFYSDANQRTEQFITYFKEVTDGKGDVEKFVSDMGGEQVKAKVNFDISLAKKVSNQIDYTPAFFIDGKFIDWSNELAELNKDKGENEKKLTFVDYFSDLIEKRLDK